MTIAGRSSSLPRSSGVYSHPVQLSPWLGKVTSCLMLVLLRFPPLDPLPFLSHSMVDHSTITIKGGNPLGHGINIVVSTVVNAHKRASGAIRAHPKKGLIRGPSPNKLQGRSSFGPASRLHPLSRVVPQAQGYVTPSTPHPGRWLPTPPGPRNKTPPRRT